MREDHHHPHDHEHDHHTAAHRPHREPVILDIGGDLGALIVYTDSALLHSEIEISATGEDTARSHKDVLERVVGGRSVYAAVFDKVPEGAYTLWHNDNPLTRNATIAAGTIAELDWTTR
jgi:hypothetical protein